jgi:hypothetical protein
VLQDPRLNGRRFSALSNDRVTDNDPIREEVARIRKVADTLCTAHANLRDRYTRRALVLDLAILGSTVWLVAVAFAPFATRARLSPSALDPDMWIGLLGVGTFALSLIQVKTDWKSRSDAHKRTLELYSEVKREAGYVLASQERDEYACRRVLSRYDLAAAVGLAVPESEFLDQKRRHKIKVAISKKLDTHPAASVLLTHLRLWWRDNITNRD